MKERRKTMRIIDSPHPSLQPLLRRTTLPSSSRNVSKITVVLKKSYTRNFLGHKNLRLLLLLRLLPFYSIWYIMDFECRTLLLAYALCSSLSCRISHARSAVVDCNSAASAFRMYKSNGSVIKNSYNGIRKLELNAN